MKHYIHYQDGKWYELKVLLRKADYPSAFCRGCAFFHQNDIVRLCHADENSFASNTCCDCGGDKTGIWREIGEEIMRQKYLAPKYLLLAMERYYFTYNLKISTLQAVASYCRTHNISYERIGTRRFYNTNDFFKSLWNEGLFEVAINGDIEVEDE